MVTERWTSCSVFCLEHQASTPQRSDHIVTLTEQPHTMSPRTEGSGTKYAQNGFLYHKASIEETERDWAPTATWGIERDTFKVIGKFP